MGKVIVIGAGIAGLASAIRMAVKGYEVKVFEKNHFPGGKLGQLNMANYRFDTGPSLFTLPGMIDDLFLLAGKSREKYITWSPLDNVCRYFYPDGKVINSFSNPEAFALEAHEKAGEPSKNVEKYLENARMLYNLAAPVFINNSLHKISNYLKPEYKKTLFYMHRFDFFNSLHHRNKKSFTTQHLVQLFDRYATYNGSNPYQTPATLKIIAHLEHNMGAFFPDRGMHSVANGLYQLASDLGVQFCFNTKVTRIETLKKKVTGIETEDGNHFEADYFVSDCDVYTLYKNFLSGHRMPFTVSWPERSSSALIFYWGIKHELPQLSLHNILFSADYKGEFEALFKQKSLFHDPTVYIFISAKHVPGDAPKGSTNGFVMINAPQNCGQDWVAMRKKARENIILKINRMLNLNIETLIESEHVNDPVSIEENTLSHSGSLYGNSSNSMLSAFLRHPNFSRNIKNLYFTGGSVHPGGGIPLCLASAAIACNEIKPAAR